MHFGHFNLMGYRTPGTKAHEIYDNAIEQVKAAHLLGPSRRSVRIVSCASQRLQCRFAQDFERRGSATDGCDTERWFCSKQKE